MSVESTVEVFCKNQHIAYADVWSESRIPQVCHARYMIWHYLHYSRGMSANELARRFSRNRPSVFRGIRIIKHLFKYHKDLRDEYTLSVKEIEGVTNATPSAI